MELIKPIKSADSELSLDDVIAQLILSGLKDIDVDLVLDFPADTKVKVFGKQMTLNGKVRLGTRRRELKEVKEGGKALMPNL